MMQLSKKIPFDDPMVLNGCRALYVISNVIILGLYFYSKLQIDKKNDMTVIKYVEPPPMGSAEEPKAITTTIKEYDMGQLRSLIRAQLMGVGMMGVMHLYFKYTNPLLIQSIIPVKSAFEGNLIKIHVLGKAATGDLKRPWKANSGFMGAMQQGEVKTDKKSVEAAERSGRGGAKEE